MADTNAPPPPDDSEFPSFPGTDVLALIFGLHKAYHWVPIHGITPNQSLTCIHAFIKSYTYRLTAHPPPNWDPHFTRTAAIILGASRAVMAHDFDLTCADIEPKEAAEAVLSAHVPADGAGGPVYTVLLDGNMPHVGVLSEALLLDEDEKVFVDVVARSAKVVIPLQGYSLINDGENYYVSDKSSASFKAFLDVERHLWRSQSFKEVVSGRIDVIRDLIWNKSGRPVKAVFKEDAAMNPAVKANLQASKLGSAAVRLPAVESDVRIAATYLKLADAVNIIWATMGGSMNADVLRFMLGVVERLKRNAPPVDPPLDFGNNERVATREEAIRRLKVTVGKNGAKVAKAFGFYCAMMESDSAEKGKMGDGNLRYAFCLKKLKRDYFLMYIAGVEMCKDYRCMVEHARRG